MLAPWTLSSGTDYTLFLLWNGTHLACLFQWEKHILYTVTTSKKQNILFKDGFNTNGNGVCESIKSLCSFSSRGEPPISSLCRLFACLSMGHFLFLSELNSFLEMVCIVCTPMSSSSFSSLYIWLRWIWFDIVEIDPGRIPIHSFSLLLLSLFHYDHSTKKMYHSCSNKGHYVCNSSMKSE